MKPRAAPAHWYAMVDGVEVALLTRLERDDMFWTVFEVVALDGYEDLVYSDAFWAGLVTLCNASQPDETYTLIPGRPTPKKPLDHVRIRGVPY